MAGRRPTGKRVQIWDDDHYYMGGVLAELLKAEGYDVTLSTPAAEASIWTHNTMEQAAIQARLIELGITLRPNRTLESIAPGGATLACAYTGREEAAEADAVILVTARLPDDALARDLAARKTEWQAAGIEQVAAIGDALAPATIAHAVYAGRRYAEELDGPAHPDGYAPILRERPGLVAE